MTLQPPIAVPGQRIVGEPERLRHELAWPVELPDGRRALLAQLAPELAAEPVLRRRWVADMERIAALAIPELAPTLALGPAPDPRAQDAEAPWRLRLAPSGATLEQVLARAPLPLDEAIELGARLADALQHFHDAGAVLRDLDPRTIVVDDQLWFTDVGQARLAILSSRTASSLLVESSPYVAPEALLSAVVDARSDVYSLGIVLWRALTAALPFEASLLGNRGPSVSLVSLRAEVPETLGALVERCIARDAEQRPPTARDVADALRGRSTERVLAVTRAPCQACGAAMRVGLRLCLACGKEAVQFRRTTPGDPDGVQIVLEKAVEEAAFEAKLRGQFEAFAAEVPKLNFVIGDQRMYDKKELVHRHTLPTVLVGDLAPETATALVKRMRDDGLKIRTVTPRKLERRRRRGKHAILAGGASAAAGIWGLVAGGSLIPFGALGIVLGIVVIIIGGLVHHHATLARKRLAIGRLRETPAALPASDPLVAKIAATLATSHAADIRTRLEEIALLVQRSVDARAAVTGDAAALLETDLVTGPVTPLVDLACATVDALTAVDAQLATLDEASILRALARCEARREAPELRQELLEGLDRLRDLEEQRTQLFGRLLEITSLTRTAVELGLRRTADVRSADAEVARAFAALEAGDY